MDISSPVRSIIIDVDGAMHSGEYYTHDRSVVVHYQGRKKAPRRDEPGELGRPVAARSGARTAEIVR